MVELGRYVGKADDGMSALRRHQVSSVLDPTHPTHSDMNPILDCTK